MIRKSLLRIIPALALCSCSHTGTFIVEGDIRDVKDSAIVLMNHIDDPVSGHALGVGTDTLKDGRFRFEVPVEDGSDQYVILFLGESFPPNGPILFAKAGKKATVSGRGYLAGSYAVRSRIRNQREWNRFEKVRRKDIESNDRLLLARKEYDPVWFMNARDSISTSIFWKELPLLKKMDVSEVWMKKVHSEARYCANFRSGKEDVKEELRSLLGRCTEEQMKTDYMVSAARYLGVIVPLCVGERLPEMTLHDADGLMHRLSEFKGRDILLEFSELGCGPCVLARPEIESLCTERPEDFTALCINMNRYDVWRPRAESHEAANMLEFNDDDGNKGVFARFRTGAIPTFVLTDTDFVIRDIWTGYTEGSIRKRVTGDQ